MLQIASNNEEEVLLSLSASSDAGPVPLTSAPTVTVVSGKATVVQDADKPGEVILRSADNVAGVTVFDVTGDVGGDQVTNQIVYTVTATKGFECAATVRPKTPPAGAPQHATAAAATHGSEHHKK